MKDKTLSVLYHRLYDGGLGVWVYRGIRYLVAIEVSVDNRVQLVK